MARPRWLLASRSMRPLRTIAGAVNRSSTHCRRGRGVQRLLGRRRGRTPALVPSAAWARWNRWARSASSNWRAAGDRVENGGGDTGEGTAFQLGVVLDADPGQGSHLTAAQTGYPSGADVAQARLLGGDLGLPRE